MRGVVETVGIWVCKEEATWKIRRDSTVKEGWDMIEVIRKFRKG